jgi:ElaB/YqjD/DUF883 family membrane-anchored ribosome-binding protein
MIGLAQHLNEMKAELQELYDNLDHELRSTDNQGLFEDSYHNVTSKLETALSELDTLINDIDHGIYDSTLEDDGTLEVEDDI